MNLKSTLRRLLQSFGYEIRNIRGKLGHDSYVDMRRLARATRPVVFDVGANIGQSIRAFRSTFPQATIHAFEPSPTTFARLQEQTAGMSDVVLNNCGVGAEPGVLPFIENTCSDMSSFLEPGADTWGKITRRLQVPVCTLDEYTVECGVSHIDVLKSDTQGFDLEVLRGAAGLLEERRVQQIYLEITFCELYKKLPRLDAIYAFLSERGFELVSFYTFHYHNGRAGWTDALFVQPEYAATPVPADATAQ